MIYPSIRTCTQCSLMTFWLMNEIWSYRKQMSGEANSFQKLSFIWGDLPGKHSTHFFLHRPEWFFIWKNNKDKWNKLLRKFFWEIYANDEDGGRGRHLLDSICRSTMNLELESISLQSHTESCVHCCGTQRLTMEAYVYFWVHKNKMSK